GHFDGFHHVFCRNDQIAANFFLTLDERTVRHGLPLFARQDLAFIAQWFAGLEFAFAAQIANPSKPLVHVLLHLFRRHLFGVGTATEQIQIIVGLFSHVYLAS